jgi:hypothetical protein
MKIMKSKLVAFVQLVAMAVMVAMVSAAPTAEVEICEDGLPSLCSTQLQPHYCYLELNRKLCCRTCMQFKTDDLGCPYGDHYAKIVRNDASGTKTNHNCEDYVRSFGRQHCQEPSFRDYCCKTCKS